MRNNDGEAAALAQREKTPRSFGVGVWQEGQIDPALTAGLGVGAQRAGAEAVVWTALGARFHGSDLMPSVTNICDYLAALRGDTRQMAETYIRKAPLQVHTPYRAEIEAPWADFH
jgi:hypothetical protein